MYITARQALELLDRYKCFLQHVSSTCAKRIVGILEGSELDYIIQDPYAYAIIQELDEDMQNKILVNVLT